MHIGIGAAILILGLLFLATSKAGLRVLAVLAIVVAVGGVYIYRVAEQEEKARTAPDAVKARCEKEYQTKEFRDVCERDGGY
jgi:undecaprenyl pyrophosphate phosphatase UppP